MYCLNTLESMVAVLALLLVWMARACQSNVQLLDCAFAGPTRCRDTLLTSRGWKVLVVPYSVWLQLQGDLMQQQAYLRELLLGVVAVSIRDRDEFKVNGKSADNSNASTDDEEVFEAPSSYAAV